MSQAKPSPCSTLETQLTTLNTAITAVLADTASLRYYSDRDVTLAYLVLLQTAAKTRIAYFAGANAKTVV